MSALLDLVDQIGVIKNDLKASLINKGIAISDLDDFTTYASKVNQIDSESKFGLYIDDFIGDMDGEFTLHAPVIESKNYTFNTVKKIGEDALKYLFYYNNRTGTVSFPDLEEIENRGLYHTFSINQFTSVSFPKLKKVGNEGLYSFISGNSVLAEYSFPLLEYAENSAFYLAFQNCDLLRTVYFPKLKYAGNYAFTRSFQFCSNIESVSFPELEYAEYNCFEYLFQSSNEQNMQSISFPKLKYAGNSAFSYAFSNMYNQNAIDITFDNLAYVGSSCFYYAFQYGFLNDVTFSKLSMLENNAFQRTFAYRNDGVVNIYFPALTEISFHNYHNSQSKNYFYQMLQSVQNCTLHFPSNLEDIISTFYGYPNFGGSNNTVLYDLPATTTPSTTSCSGTNIHDYNNNRTISNISIDYVNCNGIINIQDITFSCPDIGLTNYQMSSYSENYFYINNDMNNSYHFDPETGKLRINMTIYTDNGNNSYSFDIEANYSDFIDKLNVVSTSQYCSNNN